MVTTKFMVTTLLSTSSLPFTQQQPAWCLVWPYLEKTNSVYRPAGVVLYYDWKNLWQCCTLRLAKSGAHKINFKNMPLTIMRKSKSSTIASSCIGMGKVPMETGCKDQWRWRRLHLGLQQYTGVPVHRYIFATIRISYIEQAIVIFTIHLHMHQQTWESTVFN